MSNLELFRQTSALVQKQFFPIPLEESVDTFEQLHAFLSSKILALLDKSTHELIHILYRIDVDERKVAMAFYNLNGTDLSDQLASLILERLKTKAAIRKKYSSDTN